MNSERLAQHPGTEEMPEAVRDEVGIVAAAFPAHDRHGEEDRRRSRRPERCGPRRSGADGGREGDVAPTEAVRPGRAAEAFATTRLDGVENCRDGRQRPDAQTRPALQRPRGRKVRDVRGEESKPGRAPQPGRRPLADGGWRYESKRSPEALLPQCMNDVRNFWRPPIQHARYGDLVRVVEQAN